VFEFGESEGFQEWGNINAEAAAEALFQSVPGTDGIVRRAAPGFDRAFFSGLLFVGAAEFDPITGGLQHGVEVIKAASVVVKNGFADGADEDFDAVFLVGVPCEL